jgi:hypothetical protein
MHFLSSRHGVRVSLDVVRESIVLELAGSFPPPRKLLCGGDIFVDDDPPGAQKTHEEDGNRRGSLIPTEEEETQEEEDVEEPKVDICQMLALLLIPFLRSGNIHDLQFLRGKNEIQNLEDNAELLQHVLEIALNNLQTELDPKTTSNGMEPQGIWLSVDIMREILETFGEYGIPTDLIEDMVEVARSGLDMTSEEMGNTDQVFLDAAIFLHVLTADTQLYNPAEIDCSRSTHFDDARVAREFQQQALYGRFAARTRRRSSLVRANKTVGTNPNSLPFEKLYTAANIDNNADTYRSTTWFTLVWVETILLYFAYMVNSSWDVGDIDGCDNEYGCEIAKSLINWFVIFLQLTTLGFGWVMISSLGNTTNVTDEGSQKLLTSVQILMGLGLVSTITMVSFFKEHTTVFWDTTKGEINKPVVRACLCC